MAGQGARSFIDFQWVPLPSVIAQAFFVMRDAFDDLEEPTRKAAQRISDEIKINFNGANRMGWAALKDSTIDRKERGGWGSEPILVREGEMRDDAASLSSWDFSREGNGYTATFNGGPAFAKYGHFHIEGTRYMTIRNYVEIPDSAEDNALDEFETWVDEVLAVW